MSILDHYVTSAPNAQNAVDIFEGEWSSQFPPEAGALRAGAWPLFEDKRLAWGLAKLGGISGGNALELGPLEAGHTYMLGRAGAASVVAVEANTRAYLKCLIVKETLRMTHAQFLCGDFMEYLRSGPGPFDLCVASGVLYHMKNPAELIGLLSRASRRLYLWSHYFDRATMAPDLAAKFSEGAAAEHDGFRHTLYRQSYGESAARPGFCGAGTQFSHWMSHDDVLGCLRRYGYTRIDVDYPAPDHPYGPNFAIAAVRE
jgi:hypothetical protein